MACSTSRNEPPPIDNLNPTVNQRRDLTELTNTKNHPLKRSGLIDNDMLTTGSL